jgi:hypothetical protein
MSDEYVIGEVYYQFGFAPVGDRDTNRIVLSSWRYDGVQGQPPLSKQSGIPPGFLRFSSVDGAVSASDTAKPRVLFGRAEDMRYSMFSWREFRAKVIELGDDGTDGDWPDKDDE